MNRSSHPPPPAHPWHLVEPSPWPILGTLGALIAAIGAVHYFHEGIVWGTWLGGAILLLTAAGWWRDVTREAQRQHAHTHPVRYGLLIGMGLFIASEAMFFLAWFWAFFHASLGGSPSTTQWPPAGIVPLDTWSIPAFNTLVLLSSGAVLVWGERGLRANRRRQLVIGLALSAALGALFLGLQIHEYGQALFGFRQGIYPSTFYMATGFHGGHVLIGVCFLLVCLGRALAGHFTAEQHIGLRAAAWYWHFVDAVWLFLFVWVYWWSGSGAVH